MLAALVSFLLVVLFSIIVVRIGTVALKMTGLSREVASFQAQSAFSGVGFTTEESEYVVNHPVRRRVIRVLMLLGSAGLTSAMATLILTFVGQTPEEMMKRGIWLAIGLVALFLFARSRLIDRGMSYVIEKALQRFTSLKILDYEQLLGVGRGYTISKFKIGTSSWLAGKTLRDAGLDEEGIVVLSVFRRVDGREVMIGAPRPDLVLKPGDTIVCYGPEDAVRNLYTRIKGISGDLEHAEAIRRERVREEMERAMIS